MRKEDTIWLGVLREVGPPQSLHPKNTCGGGQRLSLTSPTSLSTKGLLPQGLLPPQPGRYMQRFPAVPRSAGVAPFWIAYHHLRGGCRVTAWRA